MGLEFKPWHVVAGAGVGAGVFSVSTVFMAGTVFSALFATIRAARTGSPKPFVYATLAITTVMAAIGLIMGAVLTIGAFVASGWR